MPLASTTRTRLLPSPFGEGKLTGSDNGVPTPTRKAEFTSIKGRQTTVSEGHPWNSRKRGPGDIGGNFLTQRQYVEFGDESIVLTVSKNVNGIVRYRRYDGPMTPINPATAVFPPFSNSSNADLDRLGATAIARCKPTNSIADASVFLGELLKDGIPDLVGSTLWKERTQAARHKAADEYLNIEFGWKPIVSDVNKFIRAVTHADAVLKQYERDAGRQVRRRYNFPPRSEITTTGGATSQRAHILPFDSTFTRTSAPARTLVRVRELTQRQWFSGAFTYYLPTGYDSRSAMARAALKAEKVFGLSLTPEVLWNLAPWSWAVDWFSNAGDVVSNLSDWTNDGLVLRYGYIMEHTVVRDTYTLSDSGLEGRQTKVAPLTLVSETKIRRQANPFGFGVSWSGLSPRQLAIAAALGIKRVL